MEEKQPQRLTKNKIFLISGVSALLLIACVLIFFRKSEPAPAKNQKPLRKDSILAKRNDSLIKPKDTIDK
ncbi:hypothetical protein [Elizabethkingia miricola]|uniref:hypothetical protein n=1 Tax=Elizabethkingia miricola TaxID=172045 RepID=UPI0023E1A5AC|nr:hypothetical protein [Elizabethkingia miricola]WER14086.1 hypothetical protein P0M31_04270 [Elizabethkingia miricola]